MPQESAVVVRSETPLSERKISSAHQLADELATQLESGRYWCLAVFSLLFVGFTALRASTRHFWYDELFTLYMSRLPDMATVWAALKDGADLNPPLYYAITRGVRSVLGEGHVATRMPSILGYLAMLLSLYGFVARRCGAIYGLAGMLLVAASGAYAFAFEARAYGLVLGFAALSLLFWQATGEPGRRWHVCVGFWLSLTAAVLTHCYAVLVLFPLGLGELVRSARRKRVDWPVWMAIAAASAAALSYVPLLAANNRFAVDNVVFRPTPGVLIESYRMLVVPLAAPLLLALAAMALAGGSEQSDERQGFPLDEAAAAAGFVAIPILAYLAAKFVSHIFMTRYGVTAIIGMTVLLLLAVDRRTADRRVAGAALVVILGMFFFTGGLIAMAESAQPRTATGFHAVAQPEHGYEANPRTVETDLPFVATNGLYFLEADYYGDASFVSRLVYLSDPAAARRYTGSDVFDKGYLILRKWYPIRGRIENYASFVREHRRFLIFGEFDHPLGWLTKRLVDDGASLRFLGQYRGAYGDNLLMEVTMPGGGSE